MGTRLVLLVLALITVRDGVGQQPEYDIWAVRYATIPGFPLASLIPAADTTQRLDVAMVVWVIRSAGRTVLFDTGFHREGWRERFGVTDFISPAEAVRLVGVEPGAVTDIVVSHAHWDHVGGIDLFPNATIWIQEDEFAYYTGPAWQEGGRSGGIDPEDIVHLVRRNTRGLVRLVPGDDIEILPGLRVSRVRGTRLRHSTCGSGGIRRMCWRRTTPTCTAMWCSGWRGRPSPPPIATPTSRRWTEC